MYVIRGVTISYCLIGGGRQVCTTGVTKGTGNKSLQVIIHVITGSN